MGAYAYALKRSSHCLDLLHTKLKIKTIKHLICPSNPKTKTNFLNMDIVCRMHFIHTDMLHGILMQYDLYV